MDVGLVGQPNVGKSTLFNALTLLHVPMAPYPFTTVEPNRGVSHVRIPCPHTDLGRPCQPGNAPCEEGVRWIPVQLVDVAGLVPGAHQGRGLGNRFLDDLRQAEGFLQVVDLTGATGPEGNRSAPHTFDPTEAVRFLEEELVLWLSEVLGRQWDKLARSAELTGGKPDELLAGRLAGLGFTLPQVQAALRQTALDQAHPSRWEGDALTGLARTLITTHRPRWVVANKADESTPPAAEQLRRTLAPLASSPASAEVELTLRRADQAGLIRYRPGDSGFTRVRPDALTAGQARALEGIDRFLSLWRTTGGPGGPGRARLHRPPTHGGLPGRGREPLDRFQGAGPPRCLPGPPGDHGPAARLPGPHGPRRRVPQGRGRPTEAYPRGRPPARTRRRDPGGLPPVGARPGVGRLRGRPRGGTGPRRPGPRPSAGRPPGLRAARRAPSPPRPLP